jgi:hypothetical protein
MFGLSRGFALSLIVVLLVGFVGHVSVSGALANPSDSTVMRVYPENLSANVGDNFTIQVELLNVADLFGLDVQLSWDPSIIHCVDHHKMIPVEEHPGGVLHAPTIPVKDDVDETAQMLGSAVGTRYWLAEASMVPAAWFYGYGTIFTITFKALRHGNPLLIIASLVLADPYGSPPLVSVKNENITIMANGPGDANDDGVVDILDLVQAAACYYAVEGQPNWNQFADLAPPWKLIDILDLVTISSNYGKKYY